MKNRYFRSRTSQDLEHRLTFRSPYPRQMRGPGDRICPLLPLLPAHNRVLIRRASITEGIARRDLASGWVVITLLQASHLLYAANKKFASIFTDCRLGDYLRPTRLGIRLSDADISIDSLIFFILFQHYCLLIPNQIRIFMLQPLPKTFYQYQMDHCSERDRLNVPADRSHETVVMGPWQD